MSITYTHAEWQVREDFSAAHQAYWDKLAAPGTWLTAAQRIDVAAEVRQAHDCALCERRKSALSPYAEQGEHDTIADLPDTWVEVIHRVVTDPARLSKRWFEEIIEKGLRIEEYIEILGTVVCVFSIDEFCRGLGLETHSLPAAQAGEPSEYRPAKLLNDEAWVPMVPRIIDEGPESDLWKTRGGNVIRALSLVPDEVRHMLALLKVHYLDNDEIWDVTTKPKGTLSRAQTEVVAARISSHNDCFY